MTPHDQSHLNADELDTFLTGSPSQHAASHVVTCASCAAMVAADQRVVAALRTVRTFDPSSGMQERIMASLAADRAPVPIVLGESPRSVAARRRAVAGAMAAGSALVAGVAWATINPEAAIHWAAPPLQGAGHALWISLQTVVANTAEQPWFASLRDTFASPARTAELFIAVAGVYAACLVGLRRMMTEPATDAGW